MNETVSESIIPAEEFAGPSSATSSTAAASEPLASPLPGLTAEQWRETRARLDDLRRDGEKFVRENPGRAVLYALGTGFVLGLIFRR